MQIGCTPRGSWKNKVLRRVLRRFSNSRCFLEGFLSFFSKDKVLRRVRRREGCIEGA